MITGCGKSPLSVNGWGRWAAPEMTTSAEGTCCSHCHPARLAIPTPGQAQSLPPSSSSSSSPQPSCSWPCQHCRAGRGNKFSLGSHNLMEQQERQNKPNNKQNIILNNTYMGIQTYPPLPPTSLTNPNDIFALQNCISDTLHMLLIGYGKNTAAAQMAFKSTNKIIILMIFCG